MRKQDFQMEDIYHKYYLDQNRILEIVKSGRIVFDTSALLDIYYYSESTQSYITDSIFSTFSERLWIPAQVWFEFLKNKEEVLQKPINLYNNILTAGKKEGGGYLSKICSAAEVLGEEELKEIQRQFQTLRESVSDEKKHPNIPDFNFSEFDSTIQKIKHDIELFRTSVDTFIESLSKKIKQRTEDVRSVTDIVHPSVEKFFSVGQEYSFDTLMELLREGTVRYSEEIPPGYKDAKGKIGLQKYGDLIAWKQILDESKNDQRDVLLVINDVKEDWWDKEASAPRLELMKEFLSYTNRSFWSCTFSTFLHYYDLVYSADQQELGNAIAEAQAVEDDIQDRTKLKEVDQLYKELLGNWILQTTEYQIVNELEYNNEWRVFGNYHIYIAENSDGERCLVMLNILKRVNYANILHAFNNLIEVQKYYETFGKTYEGYQYILVRNIDMWREMQNLMQDKPKLIKAFNSRKVHNMILCSFHGELNYLAHNNREYFSTE